MSDLPPPLALSMILCDAIWVDPATGKQTILGVFTELGAREFPAIHPLLAVSVCLTDAHGTIPVRLQLVDADEEEAPLFVSEANYEFPDRRAIINLVLHLTGLVFPCAGEYRFQLFANNEFVIERRLLLRQVD